MGAACCAHKEYAKARISAFAPAKDGGGGGGGGGGPQIEVTPVSASHQRNDADDNVSRQSERHLLPDNTTPQSSRLARFRSFIRAKSGAVRPTIELPEDSVTERKIQTHPVGSTGSDVPPTYGSHASLYADDDNANAMTMPMHDFGRGGDAASGRWRSASMASLTEREAAMLAGEDDDEDDMICSEFSESSQEYMHEVSSIRGISPSPLDDLDHSHSASAATATTTRTHSRMISSRSASVLELSEEDNDRNVHHHRRASSSENLFVMPRESESSEREHKEELPSTYSSSADVETDIGTSKPSPQGRGRRMSTSSSISFRPQWRQSDEDDDDQDDVTTFHRPLETTVSTNGIGKAKAMSKNGAGKADPSTPSFALSDEPDMESVPISDVDSFVSKLRSRRVTTVVFDLDQISSLKCPSDGLPRHQLKTFIDQASLDFREVVPRLHADGFNLSLTTFTDNDDDNEEGESSQDHHHHRRRGTNRKRSQLSSSSRIAGEELASHLLASLFKDDRRPSLVDAVLVVARPRRTSTQLDDRRHHLDAVCAKFGVAAPKEVVLFDDSAERVKAARAGGFCACLVKSQSGFRLSDL